MALLRNLRNVGKYQWIVIMIVMFTAATVEVTNPLIVLVVPRLGYHCDDASASFRNLSWDQQRLVMTSESACSRPNVEFSLFTSDQLLQGNLSQINGSRKCDTGFVFDRTHFDYTATEQYSLVCDKKWMISTAKTLYMVGNIVGVLTWGVVADRFGRKFAALASTLTTGLLNLLSAYAPGVIVFLISRFLIGMTCRGMYGTVICVELVRKDERVYARTSLSVIFYLLWLMAAGISMFLRDHRFLLTALSVTMLMLFCIMWLFVPESPRWLLARNRHRELAKLVEHIGKFNDWSGSQLAHLGVAEGQEQEGEEVEGNGETERKAEFADLFRTPVIRKRCIVLCIIWFCFVMTYFALIYDLDTFYSDPRISIAFSCTIELPAIMIPAVSSRILGRQFSAWMFMMVAGVVCLMSAALTPYKASFAFLGLLPLLAKLPLTNMNFITQLYTPELFPTAIRVGGLSLASAVGRLGGMLAPQVALLSDLWSPASLVTLGLVAILGATLVPLLPDTSGYELPQTLRDGEEFQKDHSYRLVIARLQEAKRRKHKTDDCQGCTEQQEPMNETNC